MSNKPELTELNSLFTIKHGNKFDLNKMIQVPPSEEAIAFVGRSGEENGIVAFVDQVDQYTPFDAGLVTVALGGVALASFVQPHRFYTAQNLMFLFLA